MNFIPLFIGPDDFVHAVDYARPVALQLKQFPQLPGPGGVTVVGISVELYITLLEPGKMSVQLLVIPVPLVLAQGHAEAGKDEVNSAGLGPGHYPQDILLIVFYKGQDGHQQNAGVDALPGKFRKGGEAPGGRRGVGLHLAAQLIFPSSNGNLDQDGRMGLDLFEDIYVPGDQVTLGTD